MPEWLWPLILQLAGFVMIFAEVVFPTGGILGLMVIASLVFSWVVLAGQASTAVMAAFFIADIIIIPLIIWQAFRFLEKSPITHKQNLDNRDGYQVLNAIPAELLGAEVKVFADLKPAGKIAWQGQIFEAISNGNYISAGETVRVVSLDENKISVISIKTNKTKGEME